MPRIRSVHPDICVSETMAAIPAEQERTFIRLLTHCDDEGRCLDNVKLLKAALYPLHDDVSAESLDAELEALHEAKVVFRYEVDDGSRYLSIPSWDEYQHPQKPKPSKYPHPDVAVERSRNPQRNTSTEPLREPSGTGGEGEKERDIGEGVEVAAVAAAFDDFWIIYPPRNGKRIGKGEALTVWKRLKPAEREAAMVAVHHYRDACKSDLTIAKDAHRWLSKRTFNDWLTPAKPDPHKGRDRYAEMAEDLVGKEVLDGYAEGTLDADDEARRSLSA